MKLKEVYQDNIMPIIIVYTQTIDKSTANGMENYISNQGINIDFVKVLAKENILPNSKGTLPAFGKDELLNLTLKKCAEALSGKMSNMMIQMMSNDIENNLIKVNKYNEDFIKKSIIDNFINDYKNLKKHFELLDYLIEILGRSLHKFYNKEKIYNASLNILIKSEIFDNINNFISYYKNETKKIIKSIIEEKAKIFIDYQVIEEKKKHFREGQLNKTK